jgi:hypothetical protein
MWDRFVPKDFPARIQDIRHFDDVTNFLNVRAPVAPGEFKRFDVAASAPQ